jgi:hypothetical protein
MRSYPTAQPGYHALFEGDVFMRLIAIVLASATLAASQSAPASKAGSASTRPVKQYTMEQFLDTTAIQGGSFSADESRLLFSSNKTGIWNAYTIPIGAARGRR